MPRYAHGAAWVAALAALWVYAVTLSPTVTWRNHGEDSGDLLVASATLGIPHPTGYPLYVVLGRVASLVPLGSVAYRINLVSALAGAASVYFLARWILELAPRALGPSAAVFGAVLGALLYAFSRGAWSQSVLAEVYTLNVAILGASLWAIARADRTGSARWLFLSAYLLGLGLANHLLILAAAPALLVAAGRRVVSRKIGFAGIVLLLLLVLWGVSLDLYLPIRASRGPEFSWGVPNTAERLWWVLTGAQYARNFFERSLPEALAHLVPGRWPVDFGTGLLLLGAGLVACAALALRSRGRPAEGAERGWIGPLLPGLAALLASGTLLSAYSIVDDVGYWMPVAYVACALAGAGLAGLWSLVRSSGARGALAVAASGLVLWGAARTWPEVDASTDLVPYVYARRSLEAVEPNALIVSEYDGRTFALWFYKATEFRRSHPDLVVAYKYLLVWEWYRLHLAKRYPGLGVPPGNDDLDVLLNRIVARNIRKRPVYLVRDDPGLAPVFRTEPVGLPQLPLFRVRLVEPAP
ncbi:MAG TPA: DUF2723 domain-containing protein [Candidatus Eisenbacteria bacterium]|nr:DUF2723 domain-containing protein [Candidatus Eisenbacteria bacterium]